MLYIQGSYLAENKTILKENQEKTLGSAEPVEHAFCKSDSKLYSQHYMLKFFIMQGTLHCTAQMNWYSAVSSPVQYNQV